MFQYLSAAALVLSALWLYFWERNRAIYWRQRGIPYVDASSFLGSFTNVLLMREHVSKELDRIYNHPKAKHQSVVGINVFHNPTLFLRDPELLKLVMVTNSNDFSARYSRGDPDFDPIGARNLFQAANPLWTLMRKKLSPVFTTGKMKQWFKFVDEVGNTLNKRLKKEVEQNAEVEVREMVGLYTLDGITLVTMAMETNSLKADDPTDFYLMMKTSFTSSWIRNFVTNIFWFIPDLFRVLRVKTFSKTFNENIQTIFEQAWTNRIESGVIRGDLIDALISIKKDDDDSLFRDFAPQAAVFLSAGFETTSHVVSATIYYITVNPEVQVRVRKELKAELHKNQGQLDYEGLMNTLPYLDMVMKETLRMCPSLPYINRECVVDGASLEPFSNFKVPKGMPVYIPVSCFHKDPQYFPNPEKFDPMRFDPTQKLNNDYTFLGFGAGPRYCIGERFGTMQVKLALVHMMKSFRTEPTANTPERFDLSKQHILTRCATGVFVKFVPDELYKS